MPTIRDTGATDQSERVEFSRSRMARCKPLHDIYLTTADTSLKFFVGKQWKEADKAELDESRRPALTINRILPMICSVYGEFSSMHSEFFFKGSRGGSKQVAGKLSTLVRHILNENRYHSRARGDVFLNGIITNRGAFVVTMGDEIDPLGGVEIQSYDPRCIMLPPDAKSYDTKDWPEVFTVEPWTYAEIEDTFGEAKADECFGEINADEDFSRAGSFAHAQGVDDAGMGEDSQEENDNEFRDVYVHEFRSTRKVWRFLDVATQDVFDIPVDEMKKDEAMQIARETGTIVQQRSAPGVYFRQFCGDTLLREGWSKIQDFTVVPYFPYFVMGEVLGMVEPLISPQEQLNKLSSQMLHIINSTANSGWQVEEGSLVSPTPDELARSGSKTGLVIVRRRGTAAAEKILPNSIPTGIVQAADRAAMDMQYISNINDGVLGHTGVNVAGKVVQEKKASMQASLQMVFDNFKSTEEILARVILGYIQAYYTEQRVFRIVEGRAPDRVTESTLAINTHGDYGAIVDDVTLGRYDVTVAHRPRQDVQDDAEFAELLQMKQIGIVIPDHQIVARSHLQNAEEMAKEMRILAGLEKTPEQIAADERAQAIAGMDVQLTLEEKRQKIVKMQAETMAIVEKAGVDRAKAQDIAFGQNARFAAELEAADTEGRRNFMLRDMLSSRSVDANITNTVLRNSANKELKLLDAMLKSTEKEEKNETQPDQ